MASVLVVYEAFTRAHPDVTRLLLDHGSDLIVKEWQDLSLLFIYIPSRRGERGSARLLSEEGEERAV